MKKLLASLLIAAQALWAPLALAADDAPVSMYAHATNFGAGTTADDVPPSAYVHITNFGGGSGGAFMFNDATNATSTALNNITQKVTGAACDGVTNDAAAINSAIASAPNFTTLQLPNGQCYIGATTILFPYLTNHVLLSSSGSTTIKSDQNITMVAIGQYVYAGLNNWDYSTTAVYYNGISNMEMLNTSGTKTNVIGVDLRGSQDGSVENITFNNITNGVVVDPISSWNHISKIKSVGTGVTANAVLVRGAGYSSGYTSTGNTYSDIQGQNVTQAIIQFTGCAFGDTSISNVVGTGASSGGSGGGGGAYAAVYFNGDGTNCTDGVSRYNSRIAVSGVDMDGVSDYVIGGSNVSSISVGTWVQGGSVTNGLSAGVKSAASTGPLATTGENATSATLSNIAAASSSALGVSKGGTGDTGSAWTGYTPTLSCAVGALTTSSASGAYKTLGKQVWVRALATLTTVGTCTQLIMTPPVTPDNTTLVIVQPILCRNTSLGTLNQWVLGPTQNFVQDYAGSNATPLFNGSTIDCNGTYESN